MSENKDKFQMENIQLSPNSLFIYSPRFIDQNKTRIRGIVRLNSGEFKEFEGHKDDEKNPFIRDLFLQYNLKEIEEISKKESLFHQKKALLEKRNLEDKQRDEELQALAQAKAQAFKLDIFQDDEFKDLKRKIRRASSIFEVTALSACAFMQKEKNS